MLITIPFVFKNARFKGVVFRGGRGVEVPEESSLSMFYNNVLREKMRDETGILECEM
ncbi:MAG: hypothetical protein V3V31_00090 [Methylococcales bacterium]